METVRVDASKPADLDAALVGCDAVISALSFHFNVGVAQAAARAGCSYFDLTEDVETSRGVRAVAKDAKPGQIFMPQCGLAPGFISIVAHHLTKSFDRLDTVCMRVGALPLFPSNALKYNLTWSTDGLINEYCNPCEAIHDGRRIDVLPLEGLEAVFARRRAVRGVQHLRRLGHAVRNARGQGARAQLQDGPLHRPPRPDAPAGERAAAVRAARDAKGHSRERGAGDVSGRGGHVLHGDGPARAGSSCRSATPARCTISTIDGENWSAIQITTAAGMCAVVDLHFAGRLPKSGFVRQEEVDLDEFLANRFGRYYQQAGPTPAPRCASQVSVEP